MAKRHLKNTDETMQYHQIYFLNFCVTNLLCACMFQASFIN